MGFCPYFRHDHISEARPSAGTSQTLFIWFFLFLDLEELEVEIELGRDCFLWFCFASSLDPKRYEIEEMGELWGEMGI